MTSSKGVGGGRTWFYWGGGRQATGSSAMMQWVYRYHKLKFFPCCCCKGGHGAVQRRTEKQMWIKILRWKKFCFLFSYFTLSHIYVIYHIYTYNFAYITPLPSFSPYPSLNLSLPRVCFWVCDQLHLVILAHMDMVDYSLKQGKLTTNPWLHPSGMISPLPTPVECLYFPRKGYSLMSPSHLWLNVDGLSLGQVTAVGSRVWQSSPIYKKAFHGTPPIPQLLGFVCPLFCGISWSLERVI